MKCAFNGKIDCPDTSIECEECEHYADDYEPDENEQEDSELGR